MSSFSERMRLVKPSNIFQIDNINGPLRNGLWDFFTQYVFTSMSTHPYTKVSSSVIGGSTTDYNRRQYSKYFQHLWHDFFKQPIDSIPNTNQLVYDFIRVWFFRNAEWYKIYDFLEFVFKIGWVENNEAALEYLNTTLERENSGYRFIENQFVPITDRTEIAEVEEGLSATSSNFFSPAKEHLSSAVQMLSDRENPDYRNSIKESISAVESISNILSGKKNGGLKPALNELQKQNILTLHPALKSGFENLYGYTSDDSGIRHALMGESTARYEDAKYMLVACSAFVNYLIARTAI